PTHAHCDPAARVGQRKRAAMHPRAFPAVFAPALLGPRWLISILLPELSLERAEEFEHSTAKVLSRTISVSRVASICCRKSRGVFALNSLPICYLEAPEKGFYEPKSLKALVGAAGLEPATR